MGRKKRVVEGLVMNLDDFMCSDIHIEMIPESNTKTDEEILAGIRSTYTCHMCHRIGFAKCVKRWRGHTLCDACHQHERNNVSAELEEYIRRVYSRGCTFCDTKTGRFHLDHINMFSKVGTVGVMIESGCSAEAIKEEIEKCQLLCVDCHMLVTAFEVRRGFIKEKRHLNRAISAGKDVTEPRQKLYNEYEAVMSKIYPLIREKVRRVGGLAGEPGRGITGSEIRHEAGDDGKYSCGDCVMDFKGV